ncbi:MAG: (d)CMP kinase [Malacoplasma sp.]
MSYKIAIDGPSASGKSTISKIIAKNNNLLFVSTGFIFRSFAYLLKENNLCDISISEQLLFLKKQKIELIKDKVFINGIDCTEKLHGDDISYLSSKISSILEIRELFKEIQRQISDKCDVIMDGRDIGTVILPDANLKIFLVASSYKRAKRRYDELVRLNIKKSFFFIWFKIIKRDWNDKHRKLSPLKKADDAFVINSSNKSIDEVVKEIQKKIER